MYYQIYTVWEKKAPWQGGHLWVLVQYHSDAKHQVRPQKSLTQINFEAACSLLIVLLPVQHISCTQTHPFSAFNGNTFAAKQ